MEKWFKAVWEKGMNTCGGLAGVSSATAGVTIGMCIWALFLAGVISPMEFIEIFSNSTSNTLLWATIESVSIGTVSTVSIFPCLISSVGGYKHAKDQIKEWLDRPSNESTIRTLFEQFYKDIDVLKIKNPNELKTMMTVQLSAQPVPIDVGKEEYIGFMDELINEKKDQYKEKLRNGMSWVQIVQKLSTHDLEGKKRPEPLPPLPDRALFNIAEYLMPELHENPRLEQGFVDMFFRYKLNEYAYNVIHNAVGEKKEIPDLTPMRQNIYTCLRPDLWGTYNLERIHAQQKLFEQLTDADIEKEKGLKIIDKLEKQRQRMQGLAMHL